MNEELPEGWLPIPFGVEEREAPELAARLARIAAETLPGFTESAEARVALTATIARLPVTTRVIGRAWHAVGPSATGAVADLSVIDDAMEAPDSPFACSIPQRTFRYHAGRAVLSLVAPAEHMRVGTLLRAQRRDDDRVLVADVVGADASVLGLIVHDVISLVGGVPLAGDALAASARIG